MPKPKQKFPRVFLACPFDEKTRSRLNYELDWLPWKIKMADDKITSDHLLVKIGRAIKECDFAVFDITGWNSNVCLELGLAKGLGKGYYIINNNTVKKDVPSDIKGIDRIDYNWNKTKKAASLFQQLGNGIFKRQFITAAIWKQLEETNRGNEKFTLCLYILSRFRSEKKHITMDEIRLLARGLHFKKQEDFDEVVNVLMKQKIFRWNHSAGVLVLVRSLYR